MPLDAIEQRPSFLGDPASGEDAEHRRGDRRKRGEQAFRVPVLAARPNVIHAEDRSI